jgi:hypothetical protein
MAYFKINGTDFSKYVNKLLIDTKHKYTARENASGNLMVKYIAKKHNVQVGIIPLDAAALKSLESALKVDPPNKPFEKEITYLDPETNSLRTIRCIIPIHTIEYYTIQAGNVMTKAFTFTCEEL